MVALHNDESPAIVQLSNDQKLLRLKIIAFLSDFPNVTKAMMAGHIHPLASQISPSLKWRDCLQSLVDDGTVIESSMVRAGTGKAVVIYRLA